MAVKVLDGSEVNGWIWVSFGALTDLEYSIEVVDRHNACRWTYDNPAFTLTSHADTMAHNGAPLPCPPAPLGAAASASP